MNFIISKELGDAILAYLIKQPYHEVVDIVEKLRSLPSANIVQQPEVPATSQQSETPEATS